MGICLAAHLAAATELPKGEIIDSVTCAADASQSYSLYIPSNYTPGTSATLLLAFDPRARGRTPVERYQQAAEAYGYIVAGSNNSRNGSWEVSIAAVRAMLNDVGARFNINQKRIYTAGMSGGARVAMQFALASNGQFAGVIASSAGYPDSRPRKTLPFPVFGTAGTEDFNFLEMRRLDQALKSPHHVAIFEGSHVWLSTELATEAIEWMEIHAMKSGLRQRDSAIVEKIFAKRLAEAGAMQPGIAQTLALESITAQFDGLRDLTAITARITTLRRSKEVKAEAKKEDAILSKEETIMIDIAKNENRLADSVQRDEALRDLRSTLRSLHKQSEAPKDSADRQLARRVLRGISASSARTTKDAEYRALLQSVRPAQVF